jgi:hypothetical protein
MNHFKEVRSTIQNAEPRASPNFPKTPNLMKMPAPISLFRVKRGVNLLGDKSQKHVHNLRFKFQFNRKLLIINV